MSKSTRRVHDAQFKTKVVLEALKGHKTLDQLSSDYGIHATQITSWKQQALEGLPTLFNGQTNSGLSAQDREEIEAPLFQQIGQLKRGGPCRGKRLPQKKITDELVGDRRRLIDPAHARLSIYQQCELLGLARSTYYYKPLGNQLKIWR